MNISVGDTVRVWKFVYDREYSTTGTVEKIDIDRVRGQMVRVNGDWYVAANDDMHKCEIVKQFTPATVTPARKSDWQSMDISSGFGIGGAGSDDYSMATEGDSIAANNIGCQWKHGTRYEERCENCSRNSFEICNDCGCCERCHGE